MPQRDTFNISLKEVEDAEKIVNYQFIKDYLNAQIKMVEVNYQNKIINLLETITKFWKNILNDDFRKVYNYTKHQGAYNILGINLPNFFELKGIKTNISIIKSKEFDTTKMTNMLIDFNNKFITYINEIISIVIDSSNIKELYNTNEIIENIINNSVQDDKRKKSSHSN